MISLKNKWNNVSLQPEKPQYILIENESLI